MSGKFFFVLVSYICLVSFKQQEPGNPTLKQIQSQYNRADHLYNLENATSATDSACILSLKTVISGLNAFHGSHLADSLMYLSCYKLGVLSEVYNQFAQATGYYLKARNYALNKDQFYRIYIFAGAGYYKQNNFDSASYFLLHAEENADSIRSSEDRVRLFNTLGVLYFDNGNFLQSKNYFTHALYLTQDKKPVDEFNVLSIKLNMAICYYKLDLFEKALEIYQEASKHKLLTDPLNMNMGMAYSRIHKYTEALSAFRKVNIEIVPGVLNEMARAALEDGNKDSAIAWLTQYNQKKKLLHTNALDDGVNAFYLGNLALSGRDPNAALSHYQKAIILFSQNFSDSNQRKNPSVFNGSFAYFTLFDVLIKKAAAWEMLYAKTLSAENLKSAYDTYQSAISLISYIEKSYEMDDAKIFLKQKSGEVYLKAFSVSLMLNKILPREHFLEEAFLISEKNKASVMAAQLKEINFLHAGGTENELIRKERNVRYNIARLNGKTEEGLGMKEIQKINEEKSGYETQLAGLRRKLEENQSFYKMKYSEDFPAVSVLQNKLSSDQALISLYNTPDAVCIFVITKSAFDFIHLDNGIAIRQDLVSWIQNLQSVESGRRIQTKELKNFLYGNLVKPLLEIAAHKEEWIIVPDGLFFQIPMESLPGNSNGNALIEDHEISYEFSSRFLMSAGKTDTYPLQKSFLSFAPFSKNGVNLEKEGMGYLEKLPNSKEEIDELPGKEYVDELATKSAFLENLNRFQVVHLATHAVTDMNDPSASFIAFSPLTGRPAEDLLFLDEVYGLRMDNCQMVVISACETGRGKLETNEGVMSFARAFLYAGCPSTINTLWKADDRSTAIILKKFYYYLRKGYSKSSALRMAKLDFINENPLFRNPAYWSHLVLTGDPEALYKKKQPWIWVALGLIFSTILFLVFQKKKEKKVDGFNSKKLDV